MSETCAKPRNLEKIKKIFPKKVIAILKQKTL